MSSALETLSVVVKSPIPVSVVWCRYLNEKMESFRTSSASEFKMKPLKNAARVRVKMIIQINPRMQQKTIWMMMNARTSKMSPSVRKQRIHPTVRGQLSEDVLEPGERVVTIWKCQCPNLDVG